VIVTDGEERIGLEIVRSLGKMNIDITASAKTKIAAAFFSRYSKKNFVYPNPEQNIKNFIRGILNHIKNENYDVLIPVSDYTVFPISVYRKKIEPFVRIPLVKHETLVKTYSKIQTVKIAMENSILCPKTIFPKNIKDVKKLSSKLDYPVVIKPDRSKFLVGNKILAQQVQYVNNSSELIEKYKIYNPSTPPMIQEFIPGRGYGFFALFNQSKPRAIFMHRRIREYPVKKGASSLRESVYDPKIKRLGIKMLKALKWHGVAMVEFKLDNRDKKLKLMEVNGRFWGSLPLASASGVNFPYLLYKMSMDGDVKSVLRYKVGVKSRWLVGDILHLVSVLTESYDKKTVGNVEKIKTLLEFLKFYDEDLHYDIFSLDDILPGFVNLFYTLNLGINHIIKS